MTSSCTRRCGAKWLAVAVMTIAALAGCGGDDLPDTAAHVNGQPVPTSDVVALRDWYLNNQQNAAGGMQGEADEEEVLRTALSFQIEATLVRQLANKMAVRATQEDLDKFREVAPEPGQSGVLGADSAMASHLAALSRAMARELFPEVEASDKEVDRAYREHVTSKGAPWRARTEIALFPDKTAAAKFHRAVDAKPDFVSLARKHNALEADKVTVTSVTEMNPKVIDTVSDMGGGEIADPVRVKDYWLSIRVVKRTEMPESKLAEIRSNLKETLSDQKRHARFKQWLDERLQKADVEVDDHFGRWDEKTLAVV